MKLLQTAILLLSWPVLVIGGFIGLVNAVTGALVVSLYQVWKQK